jgi:hypothetical protein
MSDMHNLEQFLGLEKDSKHDSGEHPFDLSYVHSQIADYPDFSDAEPDNVHQKQVNEHSNDEMSAIASDSSYAEKLRPKMVEDSDGSINDETIKVRT